MGLWALILGRKKGYPLEMIGWFGRIEDKETHTSSMQYHGARLTEEKDIIGELWNKPQKNILCTGMAGSGKSTPLEALVNEITDLAECKKYGFEPQNVVIFSPKHFDEDEPIDFDLGRATLIDCSKNMINPFEDADAFVASWEVLTSNITSKGIMASHIAEFAGTIVRRNPCKSWDDFRKNLNQIRRDRNSEFSDSELNYIEDKIQYLAVDATINEIPIENVIFYLGNLKPKARAFYYELFLQKYARELNSRKIEKKPILVLDEIHLIAHENSIVGQYLRELRTRVVAIFGASQNADDLDPKLLHFEYMPAFKTQNLKPFEQKATMRDCIAKLSGSDVPIHSFVNYSDTQTDDIFVYRVNEKYAKKLKAVKEEL